MHVNWTRRKSHFNHFIKSFGRFGLFTVVGAADVWCGLNTTLRNMLLLLLLLTFYMDSFFLRPDFRLHVSVYFQDLLIREVTTSTSEGCHITPCPPDEKHYLQSGRPEVIPLPVDSLSPVHAQRRADECPPSPSSLLDRGVLVWMRADGLYAQRQCQSRVYWQGGLSPYGEKFNKLEREVPTKLFHTQDYLTGETANPHIN